MARTQSVSDDQIVEAFRNAAGPLTANDLGLKGVNAGRLKTVPGVVVAGSAQTGKRGRPALLFGLEG